MMTRTTGRATLSGSSSRSIKASSAQELRHADRGLVADHEHVAVAIGGADRLDHRRRAGAATA